MKLIGVTGTNGKTTTTHLIEHLSSKCGVKSALFGTLYNRWPNSSQVANHTTAFGDVLQKNKGKIVSLLGKIKIKEWGGRRIPQLHIEDIG